MSRFKFTVTPDARGEKTWYKVACEGHPLCSCDTAEKANAVIDDLAFATIQSVINKARMGPPRRVFVQSGSKRIGIIRPERWAIYDAAPIDYWTTTPFVRCMSEMAERAAAAAGYTGAIVFIDYGYGVRSKGK
jgi:hypothetical protein